MSGVYATDQVQLWWDLATPASMEQSPTVAYCLERELHGIFLKIIGAKVSPRLVSITFIINSK